MKVVYTPRTKPWAAIAVAGGASVVGAAGLAYYLQGVEAERRAEEERVEAEQRAAEERAAAEEQRRQALLAEEAARQARAEAAAREEAQRAEAAAEARRQELLHEVARAFGAVKRPGVTAEAAGCLEEALRAVAVESVLLDKEVVVEARARLAEIRQVSEARDSLEVARAALQEGMLSRSASACRSALATIDSSTELLTNFGEAVPADGGLADQGRSDLEVLEQEEMEAARRQAAMAGLEAAVKTRQADDCAKAIAEARVAGIGPCPAFELAEVLSDPERLYKALAREGAERIMEQQGSLTVVEGRTPPPLSVEDFTAAAKISASALDEAELRQRVADLARAIVVQHQLRADELQAELQVAEGELTQRTTIRMDEAMEHFRRMLAAERQEREAALEEIFRRRTHEAMSEAIGQIFAEAETQIGRLRGEADEARKDSIAAAREDFQRRFESLGQPLVAFDELVKTGKSLQQRSQISNKLASALLKLEGALVAGQPAYAELAKLQAAAEEIGSSYSPDGFVSRLLSALPAETVEWSRGHTHSEPQLADTFKKQLGNFVAGAFALPAEGRVAGMISSFTSAIFGHFYVLGSEPTGESPLGSAEVSNEVQQNLQVLGKAAQHVEVGDLRLALGTMEDSLTGECRRRATTWMTETRNALLLQQAARAAHAKARCLHAVIT